MAWNCEKAFENETIKKINRTNFFIVQSYIEMTFGL
jgi:hypothetical protein